MRNQLNELVQISRDIVKIAVKVLPRGEYINIGADANKAGAKCTTNITVYLDRDAGSYALIGYGGLSLCEPVRVRLHETPKIELDPALTEGELNKLVADAYALPGYLLTLVAGTRDRRREAFLAEIEKLKLSIKKLDVEGEEVSNG